MVLEIKKELSFSWPAGSPTFKLEATSLSISQKEEQKLSVVIH
jgi:hypothetical protein